MKQLKQGMIHGPGTGTSDSILARVSNGEYILPKAVVDLVGKKSLDNLRQKALAFQRVPKYAMGGEVNDTSLADSYNRATATTQATNQMLRGGATTPSLAAAPTATPPANAFAQQQAAYNTARSSADPLDVASGRFDRGYQAPMASPMARNPMAQDAFASRQAAYNTARSNADPLDVASGRFDKGYQPPRFAQGGLVDDVERARQAMLRRESVGKPPLEVQRAAAALQARNAPPPTPDYPIPQTAKNTLVSTPTNRWESGPTRAAAQIPLTHTPVSAGNAQVPISNEVPTNLANKGKFISPPRITAPTVGEPPPPPSFGERLAAGRARNATPPPVQGPPTRGQALTAKFTRVPKPTITVPPAPGFFSKAGSFLAGGAVPTYAASIAKAIDASQNPANTTASNQDIAFMAEDNPVLAERTFGKERVAQAFAASQKTNVVKYGDKPRNTINQSKAVTAPKPEAPTPYTLGQYKDAPLPQYFPVERASDVFARAKATDGSASFAPGTGIDDASVMAGARSGRGGFVGAATDAEAARNIQSRLEQDAAASQVVASMNRGAEAERDTRAAKLGISRAVLDQMEGRMDSPAVQALQERQNAQKPYEAMEQALSAYRNEQAAIDKLRSGGPKGFGQRKAAERYQAGLDARAAAAENMLNAGLGVGKQRLDAETARQQARANAQAAQFQEEGQNRRADLTARTQLQNAEQTRRANWEVQQLQELGQDRRAKLNSQTQLQSTELAQRGGIAKEALQQQALDTRTGTKSMEDSFKSGADYITAVTSADGKNPPQVSIDKLMRFREGLDLAKLTELVGKEKAHRIKAGQLHPEEAQWLVGRVKQWNEDPKSIWNLYTAEKATPTYSSAGAQ